MNSRKSCIRKSPSSDLHLFEKRESEGWDEETPLAHANASATFKAKIRYVQLFINSKLAFSDRPNLVRYGYVPETNAEERILQG